LINEYQNTDFLKESNINGLALDMSDVIDNLFDPGSALLRGIVGIFGNKQKTARERQDEINDAIKEANKRKIASFNSRIRQVQNRQKFADMQNMMAFGGPYHIDGAINYDLAQKNLENKR
jgi:predicted nucleotide-binding protein (sugar kinase/HSP70/actin superfamily)